MTDPQDRAALGERFMHKPVTCGVLCLCHSNVGAGQRGDPLTGPTRRRGMATQGGQAMTTPQLPQAINLTDPAFREVLAVALYEVDFETNPELWYIASAYDLDLYREQADKVLRKLRTQFSRGDR